MNITCENANEIGNEFSLHDGIIMKIEIMPLERSIEISIDIKEWGKQVFIAVKDYVTFSTTAVSNADYPRLLFGTVGVAEDFGVEMQNFDKQFDYVLESHGERDVNEYVTMILESKDGDVLKAVCKEVIYEVVDQKV